MTYDSLIIGAGISGLGLAHLCTRAGLRTVLLEGTSRVGGCIATHTFPESGGFWVETGAHTCYNSYGHLLEILADLELVPKPKTKVSFKLLDQGRPRSVLSRLHPWELARSLPRLAREPKSGRTVKDYYSRVLGERNYRDLFGPAFNAVICQPADSFPADLLFRRKPRHKDQPRSYTFPEGLSTIPEAIAKQPGLEVLTEAKALQIQREGDEFRVTTADGRLFAARHLALAVPPNYAATLLTEAFPELAQLLGEIAVAKIESVSVAIPQGATRFPPLAGIIAPHEDISAVVSRDYLADPRGQRGFTFHFRPDRLDPEEQMQCICQILGIPSERITAVARSHHQLPALRAGHTERVARIDQALAGSGLFLTGNYFFGVSIEDCLTRSAAELKRLTAGA